MKKKLIIIGLMITALCLAAGCQSKTEVAPPLEAEIIEDEVSMETQKQKNSTENNFDSEVIVSVTPMGVAPENTSAANFDTGAMFFSTVSTIFLNILFSCFSVVI